jgi:N-acetyl-anhydromuramyl-L-alanine amidase AmpD
MNRRNFVEKLVGGCAVAAGSLWIAGCGPRGTVTRRPPPPIFGRRRRGGQPVLEAPESAPPSAPRPAPAPAYRPSPGDWRPPGPERRWQYIVLHHSATPRGSAAIFDRIHRSRGWDELGYHFVIGNGHGSPDGLIEIGSRWTKQKHGAHCKVAEHPEYNDFGVGICLVGNFDKGYPSDAQVASCAEVVRFLMHRYGVPPSRVRGHRQLKPTTRCPGSHFPYRDVYRRLA